MRGYDASGKIIWEDEVACILPSEYGKDKVDVYFRQDDRIMEGRATVSREYMTRQYGRKWLDFYIDR